MKAECILTWRYGSVNAIEALIPTKHRTSGTIGHILLCSGPQKVQVIARGDAASIRCGGMMAEVQYVNEADFQKEVLNEEKPVLVDFTAVWCQPCRMVDPIVKQLAADWEGKVKVVKLDADQNPNLLTKYGVLGIPTLMLFRGGEMKERLTGYQPKERLVSKLNPHIEAGR